MNMETITAMDRIRRAATDALAMAGQAVSHLRELEYDAGSFAPYADNPELVSGTIRSNFDNALAALADAHQQLGRASWAVGLLEDSALHELDRGRTVTIGDLIGIARDLIEPGSRPRAGNPEYERAITELISIAAGITEEGRNLVTGALGIRDDIEPVAVVDQRPRIDLPGTRPQG